MDYGNLWNCEDLADGLCEVVDARLDPAADIDNLPDGRVLSSPAQDCPGRIFHIVEVARVNAAAKDHNGPPGHAPQHELWNDLPTVAFLVAAWAVNIEQPQHHRQHLVANVRGPGLALGG